MTRRTLDIRVFDVTKGDCILIQFPNRKVGVVDCAQSESGFLPPSLRWLQDRGIKEVEFVCLTHPHVDHLAGMHRYFAGHGIRVKQFWHTAPDVYMLMSKCNDRSTIRGLPELRRHWAERRKAIIEVFRAAYEYARSSGMRVRRVGAKSDQLASIGGVTITALAPSEQNVEKFQRQVCADFDAGLSGSEKRVFNLASAILLLEWKSYKVILGGDAPRRACKQLISWTETEAARQDLAAEWQLVKVAHHAASDCFFPGMWEQVLISGPAVLVVSSDGIRHPSQAFFQSCRTHDRVYCTRRPAACISGSLHSHAEIVCRYGSRRAFAATRLCSADITVRIDESGETEVQTALNGPYPRCHKVGCQ